VVAGSRVGVADRVRRPFRAALNAVAASWTIESEENGHARYLSTAGMSTLISVPCNTRPGVRPGGPSKAEPGRTLGRCHDDRPPGPDVSGSPAAARDRQGHFYRLHRPSRRAAGIRPVRRDFAARADNLAHGFGAVLCRVRTGHPGSVVLELVRRDALALIIPALPIPAVTDLRALVVGLREDGNPWLVRLHGTHLLLAGSTGAGKASLLWGVVRALLPGMRAGLVRPLTADPKLMELAYGRAIFDRYGTHAADPDAIVAMLEQAVADMRDRAAQLAGRHREHTPTAEHPFVVIFVDEVAFLTAYQPDKSLRERVKAALSTLTTQGRAVGYCVVAALQDPRKEVMSIRNLFPDRIAMRLDEPEQVDMVLGDGARDRGALADRISTNPPTGAGVAFIRLATDPDPVRVRAAFVIDADIRAMVADYAPIIQVPAIEAGAAA
jgi:FtsK/SpoIIIE family